MLKKLIKLWHTLTVSVITIMFATLLFYLGLNPLDVGKFVGVKIGSAVGFNITSSASVAENPFNKLALQLREKEDGLNEREKNLDEIQQNIGNETGQIKKWLLYLTPLVAAVFILILMNFFFDYKERKILEKIEEDERKIIEAERRLEKRMDEKIKD